MLQLINQQRNPLGGRYLQKGTIAATDDLEPVAVVLIIEQLQAAQINAPALLQPLLDLRRRQIQLVRLDKGVAAGGRPFSAGADGLGLAVDGLFNGRRIETDPLGLRQIVEQGFEPVVIQRQQKGPAWRQQPLTRFQDHRFTAAARQAQIVAALLQPLTKTFQQLALQYHFACRHQFDSGQIAVNTALTGRIERAYAFKPVAKEFHSERLGLPRRKHVQQIAAKTEGAAILHQRHIPVAQRQKTLLQQLATIVSTAGQR